jgi:hypothetical protein
MRRVGRRYKKEKRSEQCEQKKKTGLQVVRATRFGLMRICLHHLSRREDLDKVIPYHRTYSYLSL